MAATQEKIFESITASQRLGSLEHIEACARLADSSSITSVDQIQDFLRNHFVPESLAYFIFDYQTRETRRFWTPERTAVIDTRGLTGYQPDWPVFQAEYHYEPVKDNNYLSIYGRPYPNEAPEWNYAYHMRIPLTNSLELDTSNNLEAYSLLGDLHKPKEVRLFRTIAHEDYGFERDPAAFVEVLSETADGLRKYLYLRDYL